MSGLMWGAIGAAMILFFGAGWVSGYKSKKETPCDSCDHLTQKGGYWKYYCDAKNTGCSNSFNADIEYCKFYKKREVDKG